MFSMFGGTLAFGTPWVLTGLLALPALWWILRLLPPRPRLIRFPNLLLLRDLLPNEQTPSRLPLWLLLLRMVFAALLILAASQPTLNPRDPLPGAGPIIMVVDNGWASAPNWSDRMAKIDALLNRPGIDDREVLLVTSAAPANGDPIDILGPFTATQARERLAGLRPQPWRDDLPVAIDRVSDWITAQSNMATPTIYWLSDGLARTMPAERAALRLIANLGDVIMVRAGDNSLPVVIRPPSDNALDDPINDGDSNMLAVTLERVIDDVALPVRVQTLGSDDRLLGDQTVIMETGIKDMRLELDVPTELRSDIRQVRIINANHAASRVLLDDRFVRRPVGLIAGGDDRSAQPLLDQLHYLRQAFEPFAEVRGGTLENLIQQPLSVLVMADIGTLTPDSIDRLDTWIRDGGLLIRFAGPQLANASGGDSLLPVRIRQGDRALGGALSWTEPVKLAPFADNSPFAGLTIPDDVTIERQILAEPELDLNERSWARLADGTPLVTAEARGKGYLVLFHTTASPSWSNLALSGLFVEMLHRLMPLSAGVAPGQSAENEAPANLAPIRSVDGFGTLTEPGPIVQPLHLASFEDTEIDPHHPPGIYGREATRRALNLSARLPELTPLDTVPSGMRLESLSISPQTALFPWLLFAALMIGLVDWMLAQWMSGGLSGRMDEISNRWRPTRAAGIGIALVLSAVATHGAQAQALTLDEERAMKVTSGTYLGYVLTGDRRVDEISHAGLDGLAGILRRRTAAEVEGAIGVDIDRDDLALFPLLYWPITEVQADLGSETVERLNQYMRHGGMIVFDTRDKLEGGLEQGGPGVQRLRELTRNLDMPPLQPINPQHVMTRSFYLLQIFPGRYAGGEVWVERTDERRNDGVSSVMIGAHDWAAAWAVGPDNRPMLPVVPGGERQRELAYRFGVNMVMYALTGNYKADQVHVPYILERLGQ
tara:strand:+ start:11652 stop:14483 length:2832 start_codon:yes stop_codon:yes gene_type:complete